MKKIYILSALLLFTFSQLNAQYFWQVDDITNITGAGTYDQNETPTNVMLRLSQCPGGISQPHNLTNYDLEFYAINTIVDVIQNEVFLTHFYSKASNCCN